MQEIHVWSLCWEDPLEKGMAIHSSILAWETPIDREAWRATVCGVTKSDMTEQLTHTLKLSLAWKVTLLQNESEIDWDNLLFGMFGSETSCYSFLPVH